MRHVYVENGVGMEYESGSAVWSSDDDLWGCCAQGMDQAGALAAFEGRAGGPTTVAETIEGDEQAFGRDFRAATDREYDLTHVALDGARADLVELLNGASDAELDFGDPAREMPEWATWRTLREMAWHIADTESRYYLPMLGIPPPKRSPKLPDELWNSAEHVHNCLERLPVNAVSRADGEVWTTTKLLRRLAWHERGELQAMHKLLNRIRRYEECPRSYG